MIERAVVNVLSDNSVEVVARSNPPIKRIDMSKYVEKTTTIAGVDLEDDITKAELQDALTDANHNFISTQELENINTAIENKVDKVEGQGLSDENYTSEEKTKVSNLRELAYKDTANYATDITNKPTINNVEVNGSLSLNDLGIEPANATIVKDANYVHTDNNFTNANVSSLASAEQTSNKTTVVNNQSTDEQYASAKAVYTALPKNTSDLNNNSGYITKEVNNLTNYTDTNTLNTTLDKTVQTDVGVSVSGDNLSLNKSYKNIGSGSTSSGTTAIPLATDESAGLMSYEDYAQIRTNTTRISQLEGQNVRLTYTASDNPTELQISTFVAVSGYTDVSQWPTIAVVVKATNHVWRYYNNTQLWQDDGLDTVIQFTNALPGIIQGSATDGKVYAENDGTGSVYGWDALKNRVSDVETNKQDNLTAGTNITITNNVISANIDVSGKADKVASATNGNFAALDSNGNLTDSGTKASDFIRTHQDISGKADKVSSATSGNFAGLDANGNLTDSGKKSSDFLPNMTIDNTPTQNSNNLVTSGGVYTAISAKQDTIDSSHKLSADLVDDSNTTNKFVTSSEKTTWTGKQDALVSGTNIKTINGNSLLGSGNIDTALPVLTGASNPTTATQGIVNQLYRNTTSNDVFICTLITEDTSTTPSTFTYTWTKLSPLPVLTGTTDPDNSTTLNNNSTNGQIYINTSNCTIWIKMGQFSTAIIWEMIGGFGSGIFSTTSYVAGGGTVSTSHSLAIGKATTTGKGSIGIGSGASSVANSIAIGRNAIVSNANYSVQLGAGTNATANSFQIADDNIYKTDTHTLTVTNAQVNNNPVYGILSGSSAPTSATVGSVGQLYLETSTPALYFCTAVNNGVYTWETQSGGGGDSGLIIEDV